MEKVFKNFRFTEYIFPVFLLALGLVFVIFAWNAIFPFILSVALAYILNPLVNYFEVRGIKRVYVVAGLYIVAGLLLAALVVMVVNFMSFDIETFKVAWPNYYLKIQKVIGEMSSKLSKYIPFLSGINIEGKVFRTGP